MTIYASDFNENRFQVQLEILQEYCTRILKVTPASIP